ALLSLVHVDLMIGLVWVGLLSSLAIFYGFYRWGGTFAIAGFLFNGGIAGFQFFKTFQFLDYQGTAADIAHRQIAWKSIVLSMLVSHPKMWPEIFRGAPIRRHAAAMLIAAFIPATFFVWLTTDQFHAASVLKWHPGWAQDSSELGAPYFRLGPKDFGSSTMFGQMLQKTWNGVIAPFLQFWLPNFGLWVPLAMGLVGMVGWRIWKRKWRWGDRPPADIAFVLAAVMIFGVGYFV